MAEILTIRRKETGKALFFDGTNKQEVKENFLTDTFLQTYSSEQDWFDDGGEDYVKIPRMNYVTSREETIVILKGNYIVSICGQTMALSQEVFNNYFEVADETIV